MRVLIVSVLSGALLQVPALGQDPIENVAANPGRRPLTTAAPGPWGELEHYRIPLECPDEFLSLLKIPSKQTEWVFPVSTSDQLEAVLLQGGLTEPEISGLLSECSILLNPGWTRVYPTDELLINLTPEIRVLLYRVLQTYEENPYHHRPIYLGTENLTDWFQGSQLPRSVLDDVAKLAYPTPSGRGFYFSDLPFTLRQPSNALNEKVLLKGLLRRQGLIVRLRLNRSTLTQAIADYWTVSSRNIAIMPLLESVVESNEGGGIDIAHLLPATPRQYLNRYPDASNGVSGRFPDWFWTCYNFFRFSPREVYADSENLQRLIVDEYAQIIPPHQFGDMLILNSRGKPIHGCIYIAEDIVYTKNSPDMFSPWILAKLQDVVAYHDLYGDVSISSFRLRPPADLNLR